MDLNFFISYLAYSIGLIYVIIIYNKDPSHGEENFIISSLIASLLGYCFISAVDGYINLYAEIFVNLTYFLLIYCGWKSIFRTIYIKYKGKSDKFKKVNSWFSVTLEIYFGLQLLIYTLSIAYKSNLILMLNNILSLLLTSYYFINAIIFLKKEKIFWIHAFITNPITVAFTISLYEILDLTFFLSNIPFYSEWKKVYHDPTHVFDSFWIIINITTLITLPRFITFFKKVKFTF